MNKSNDNDGNIFALWEQGQKAFFEAQSEFSKNFEVMLKNAGNPFQAEDNGKDEAFNPVSAWQDFVGLWAPTWDMKNFDGAMSGKTFFDQSNAAFFKMFDSDAWAKNVPEQLREILQSVSKGPQFADLATPHIDAANAWRETLDYQKAAGDFSTVMQDAWTRTYEAYSKKFSLEDLKSGAVPDALAAWIAAANEQLLEVQRSPEFMDAQKRLLRAGFEIKARQKEMAEAWCETYQMPTRTELDDLTKTVHELRRELRKVKRDLASANGVAKK